MSIRIRRQSRNAGDWRLVLAGWSQNDHLAQLKSIAARLSINDSVSFVRPQFGDQMHMYLSRGWTGMFQGAFWGGLLGILDAVLKKNSVVWAVSLPFMTWTIYMFIRGVVGGAFSRVSPLVYAQLVILLVGYCWAEFRLLRREITGRFLPVQ